MESGEYIVTVFFVRVFSDTMGNSGAFINIKGNDLTPKFTSYKAVVSPYRFVRPMHCK